MDYLKRDFLCVFPWPPEIETTAEREWHLNEIDEGGGGRSENSLGADSYEI